MAALVKDDVPVGRFLWMLRHIVRDEGLGKIVRLEPLRGLIRVNLR